MQLKNNTLGLQGVTVLPVRTRWNAGLTRAGHLPKVHVLLACLQGEGVYPLQMASVVLCCTLLSLGREMT